ncbi:MAG: hypothetical protein ACLPJJ_13205 [Acidocella sp.]|uniref:hypothetical protein n=1 Tax=Acidocella sp. TaxID=50710 RepID=UPI003FC37599
MTEKSSDPFEFFKISQDMLTAQQKFLPSNKIFEQFTDYVRNVTQAQIAYNQALMRAQAALLAGVMERPLTMVSDKVDERPSSAAHQRNVSAP